VAPPPAKLKLLEDPPSMVLTFSGSAFFRQRILLATLSGKTVKIDSIRSEDENPGLRDFEIQFLKLVERVTNGSVIDINYTGIYSWGMNQ